MHLEKQQSILKVTEFLARWLAKIRLNTALNHYDINKVAENISLNLLNIIYDYKLVNLNAQPNFPSIDLGSKDDNVCFQITSRIDFEKIENTIRLYITNNFFKEYPNLRFLILNQFDIKFPKEVPDKYGKIQITNEVFEKIKKYTIEYEQKYEYLIEDEEKKQDRIKEECIKLNRPIPSFSPRFSLVVHKLTEIIDLVFISEKEFYRRVRSIYGEFTDKYIPFIKDSISIDYINFNRQLDILNDKNLIREIEKIQTTDEVKFQKIFKLLESEFCDNKSNFHNEFFFWSTSLIEQLDNKQSKTIQFLEQVAIPKYLKSQRDFYCNSSKTFLNDNPQPFYNTYFPVSLQIGLDSIKHIDSIKLYKFNKVRDNNFLTIIGTAGSGKSTLIRHLFINAIDNFLGIPFIIEFRQLNNYKGSINDYICETYFYKEISTDDKVLHEFFKIGKIIFMFDGYDELFSDFKQSRLSELDTFIRTYDKNKFIITSRPGTNIQRFNRFANASVKDLTEEEVFKFISQQVTNKNIAEKIQNNIQSPENVHYMEYLKNPLLLSMYIMTNKKNPEVPKDKKEFYQNIFLTLYVWHDSQSKDCFKREKLTKLQRSDFEKILQKFSMKSYFQGQYEFTDLYINKIFSEIKRNSTVTFNNDDLIHDLTISICILVQDCNIYKFPHRSLQEYFTASCINNFKEEEKRLIFSSKIDDVKKKSVDSIMNLWELCNEFDYYHFSKYYILNRLNKIFEFDYIINTQDKVEQYLKIVKLFKIEIYLKQKFKKRASIATLQEFHLIYNFDYEMSILEFLKIPLENVFWIEPTKRSKISVSFHKLFGDKEKINLFQISSDPHILNELLECGFIDFIKSEYFTVFNKFCEIKEKVKQLETADKFWIENI